MKKLVLKLSAHDDKTKQKVMKTIQGISGVESIAMDMKDQKLTVTGDVDPVVIVNKLRKLRVMTEIVSVGPAKEEKKKDEPKKTDPKDEVPEKKKDEPKKTEEKRKVSKYEVPGYVKAYRAYNPHMRVPEYKLDPKAAIIAKIATALMVQRHSLQFIDNINTNII